LFRPDMPPLGVKRQRLNLTKENGLASLQLTAAGAARRVT